MKRLIVANWKMGLQSGEENKSLLQKSRRKALAFRSLSLVVCPPFPLIAPFVKFTEGNFSIGAQDTSFFESGAHTGEVSSTLLADLGVTHVIIGHSERRAQGESNQVVNKKIQNALKAELKVILCVGENERNKDGDYLSIIKEQILSALSGVKEKDLPNIFIAYEPVWAVGEKATGAISGAELHETVLFIRRIISEKYTKDRAFKMQILYGGSVDSGNANELFEAGEVQGLLVGRASLDAGVFSKLLDSLA